MNFTVRRAQPQDLADLVDVISSSFHATTGVGSWLTPLLRWGLQEDFRQRLETAHSCFLVAIVDQYPALAGAVEITYRADSIWQFGSLQYPYLANLAVRAAYRRQGIAQALLRRCEEMAQAQGHTALHLHVLEQNAAARELYLGAGYHPNETSRCVSWPRSGKLLLRKQLIAPTHRLPRP